MKKSRTAFICIVLLVSIYTEVLWIVSFNKSTGQSEWVANFLKYSPFLESVAPLNISLVILTIISFVFLNYRHSLNRPLEIIAEENVAIENVLNIGEASFDAEMMCGFPVCYDDGGAGDWGGSGSFWMDCDDDTTMEDILDGLLGLFF